MMQRRLRLTILDLLYVGFWSGGPVPGGNEQHPLYLPLVMVSNSD